MKNTDDNLRDILRNKLNNYESAVPDALWQNVASQLPKVNGNSAAFGLTKIAAIVVAGAIITTGAILLRTSKSRTAQSSAEAPAETIVTDTTAVNLTEKPIVIQQTQHTENRGAIESTSQQITLLVPSNVSQNEPTSTTIIDNPPVITNKPITEIEATYAEEEPILPSNNAQQSPPTDPRFSVVETDKSGLTFFFIPQHTSASHYRWSFGDGVTSDELSPSHHYEEPGEYTVELTIEGVSQVFRQTVNAIPAPILEAPTIFTPNADGKNDSFDIMALSRHITLEAVRVFNTSGSLVFEGDGSTVWNGEDNHGNPLPEGNYIYTLKAKDLRQQPVEKSGTVYLRR
ncbi:MAG: gliding motility-associated C-terminal domain-containing protein [Flavobacteriales bacterium]